MAAITGSKNGGLAWYYMMISDSKYGVSRVFDICSNLQSTQAAKNLTMREIIHGHADMMND